MSGIEERVEEIPDFPFPIAPPTQIRPEYARRQAECPLGQVRIHSGTGRGSVGTLLVTYDDVTAAASNWKLTRNHFLEDAPAVQSRSSFISDPDALDNQPIEVHRAIRRVIAKPFSASGVAAYESIVQDIVDDLVTSLETEMRRGGGPVDLVAGLCNPLPAMTMCSLLELAPEDWPRLCSWALAGSPIAAAMPDERRAELLGELYRYCADLVETRRAEPRDTAIEQVIEAQDAGLISEGQMQSLVRVLVGGGHDNTTGVLTRCLLSLISGAGRAWRELVGRPELVETAVEEVLRLNPLTNNGAAWRYVLDDVELPSGVLRAGDVALIHLGAAQRDPLVFPEPDDVRFDRPAGRLLSSFGIGPYVCPMRHVATQQIRLVLTSLVRRLPGLRLAVDVSELRWVESEMPILLDELPVSW
jgi:cytochrome P450